MSFPLPESLVVVPAGSFLMGGLATDKFVTSVELPRHEVSIDRPFAMGKTPVTRGEWQNIMNPGSCVSEEGGDTPVTCVSYQEVLEFISRSSEISNLKFRLPAESEWEYACRAGSTTVFPDSNDLSTEDANFLYDENGCEIGIGGPTPSGRFPANHFGIEDMLGNVCEWTADVWHPNYDRAPSDGTPRLDDGYAGRRTIRGGAWDHLPRVLRASWRDWAPENARWDNLGFRLALTL